MTTTEDRDLNPIGATPVSVANPHIQATTKALSDMFNDGTIDAATAARIVAWAWHTAALGDCCGRAHRTGIDPDHIVMPYARHTDGRYLYACPEHPDKTWPVWWNSDLLNPLPQGWQL